MVMLDAREMPTGAGCDSGRLKRSAGASRRRTLCVARPH